MFRFCLVLIAVLSVFTACSDDSSEVEVQTKEQMLQRKWKVGSLYMDGLTLPITEGNVDKIRITFTATTYTYVYPAPPGTPGVTAGTMLTLEGTWQFNTDKTKILLDRTSISQPVFEWTIVSLSPGIFSASFVAPNGFNPSVNATYVTGYTIDV